jgi:hypothetical protein
MKRWSLGKQKNDADRERVEIPRRVLAAEKSRRSFCACALTCISFRLERARARRVPFCFMWGFLNIFIKSEKENFFPPANKSKKSLAHHLRTITRPNDAQIARNFTARRRIIYSARAQSFVSFYESKREIRSENFRCSSQKSVFFLLAGLAFIFPLSLSLYPHKGKASSLPRVLLLFVYTRAQIIRARRGRHADAHISLEFSSRACLLYTRTLVNKPFSISITSFCFLGKEKRTEREETHVFIHVYSGA